MKTIIAVLLFVLALNTATPLTATEAPKRLLVVTVTTGFRHSSISTAEKILEQLASQSGDFTVEFVRQPEGKPAEPKKPVALKPGATTNETAAFSLAEEKYQANRAAYQKAEAGWELKAKQVLMKLSPESLSNYDGVVFANTTGDLPIPDKEGFLAWIRNGGAFIGMHAASDTFHGWPGYIDMLGGEFKMHGAQVGVECLNQDPRHPATRMLGKTWTIQQEEIYQFKNYDPAKVHELLVLDRHPNNKTPGHFPVSWCREYGKGRVFYTSLGHREDIWDADPNLKGRKNPVETSKLYQAHILGGIEWALRLQAEDGQK